MKRNLIRLSQQYVAALREHLEQEPNASLQPALGLGRQATALGLKSLELARIHEQAIAKLHTASGKDGIERRAKIFFDKANVPIQETHRASRQGDVRLGRLKEKLDQRTEDLAVSNRQLQRGVVRRKDMEVAARKIARHHKKCMEESLELQKRLRQLTHQVIAVQEDERKKISRKLQDEIAQTLLGINVRLISLKQGDRDNAKSLKNEIASTQRLVVKSARTVQRYARKLDGQQPA